MRFATLWLALGVSVSMAQTSLPLPIQLFPAQLKEYLGLSDDQVNRIGTVRAQFASFQQTKLLRQYQLQAEIAEETGKNTPDPLALGVRYAEIESIRRALQTQLVATVSQTQAILNANQRAKLTNLQQALALYSTACGALEQHLISAPATGFASALSPLQPFLPSCAGVSTLAIRSGDFSVAIPAPTRP